MHIDVSKSFLLRFNAGLSNIIRVEDSCSISLRRHIIAAGIATFVARRTFVTVDNVRMDLLDCGAAHTNIAPGRYLDGHIVCPDNRVYSLYEVADEKPGDDG